jgi:YbbR domain-containing protein
LLIGPANLLDTIDKVVTVPIKNSELSDTLEKKVNLASIPGTSLPVKKVKVIIPVDRFTEASVEVPLAIKNLPDSVDIKIFPGSIKLTYSVTLSMYNKSRKSDFLPYVDFNDIDLTALSENSRLKVHLDSVPTYARSVSLYPSNVEFLIEIKHAKNRINRGNR